MKRLLIRVPLLLVEWLSLVGPGATLLLYYKNIKLYVFICFYRKTPRREFLRFSWAITLRNVMSSIRLRPGGVPIDEYYTWQFRGFIIPQKTSRRRFLVAGIKLTIVLGNRI